jgi:hypothetical protein
MRIVFRSIPVGSLLCSSLIAAHRPDEPRKLDEFRDVCCEDEKARLDYFAVELQKNPNAKGYIIFYGGQRYPSCWYGGRRYAARRPRFGEAEARAARIKPYLTNTRGLDPKDIVVLNGGFRESWMAELWIVPNGAKPPLPTSSVLRKDIRYRKGRVTRREFQLQCVEG